MSQVWSEVNKIVSGLIPVADCFATGVETDIVNMENYKKCTFLVYTGATSTGSTVITVNAGASSTGAATAIAFKYRTQVAQTNATTTGGDIPGALTDATSTGFTTTISKVGGIYIIEVDASTVAAAGTNFDHCKLDADESVNSPITGCVLAILSEPRYPQAILATAID